MSRLLLVAAVVTGALLALVGPGGGGYTSIAEADHHPSGPETLTAVAGPSAGSATLNWTAVDGATAYRVHWISRADALANLADDAWLDLLGTADLGDTDQHTVTGLQPGADYYFIVGARHADDSIAWSKWDRLKLDSVEDHRRAVTRAYVQTAIEYYEEHGREAAVEFYRTAASAEDGRTLILIDTTENTLLVYRNIPALQGQYVGPGSRYAGLSRLAQTATEEGLWGTSQGINPVTKQEEPRRVLAVLHDGLVFSSSHSALVSDVAAS
ncbi:MAG: fibronectin type III domain-containing protein, partial [Gammaproteobacteria bacterium]|nr:fibronectin type III domain-containing protein [Gammaproteobacteria bacterium]